MAGNTVSIYIDDTSVRVMVTRGKRIARIADMPLEDSLNNIDTPEKEAGLAAKIQHLLKFNKINGRKIILGLSGLHCLTRPIVLPELPKAMVGEAVVREAKRLLPMPLEQLYLTWQVTSVAGGKTNVFLTAVPRQMADMIIRIINKAGCKPYLMDIKPMALARLSREATAVILDVQQKEFDIVILVNGIPQPVRTIAFPQEALSLPDKLNMVRAELSRTLEFIKNKSEEVQLKPDTVMLVSGDLAEQAEQYESLAKELGLKAEKLSSPLKYLKYLEPSQYLVNSGLALKELVKESGPIIPNINVLPAPYQPKHISINKLMTVPAAAGAVAVLVLLAFSIQNAAANMEQVNSQIENFSFMLQKKQEQKKESLQQAEALKKQIDSAVLEYDLYSSALKQITVTGNIINNDLKTTVNNITEGLQVNTFSLGGDAISVSGTADSEEDVFAYVRRLTDTGRYEEIIVNNITLSGDGVEDRSVSFGLNCRLKEDRK